MKGDNNKKQRKTIRIKEYDYSRVGNYFITICTKNHCLFFNNEVVRQIAESKWIQIPNHFLNTVLDDWVIMPNHLHGIIFIGEKEPEKHPTRLINLKENNPQNKYQQVIPGSIGVIVRSYKAAVSRECRSQGEDYFKWHRNYYEHIIRDDKELYRIREYIYNNPLNWVLDRENPESPRFDLLHDDYWRDIYSQVGFQWKK